MKVLVTIKQTETTTFDVGDIPVNLIRDLLVKNDGHFDDNWSAGDIGHAEWMVDEVTVVEATGKTAK